MKRLINSISIKAIQYSKYILNKRMHQISAFILICVIHVLNDINIDPCS
jgi:hypothetical protein